MKRPPLVTPSRPAILRPDGEPARAPAQQDRPGRVPMVIGDDTCVADLCKAMSLQGHTLDGEEFLVIALSSPTGLVALYQPFDVEGARELAAMLIGACDEIEATKKAATAGTAS